jgi:hypothetical protein
LNYCNRVQMPATPARVTLIFSKSDGATEHLPHPAIPVSHTPYFPQQYIPETKYPTLLRPHLASPVSLTPANMPSPPRPSTPHRHSLTSTVVLVVLPLPVVHAAIGVLENACARPPSRSRLHPSTGATTTRGIAAPARHARVPRALLIHSRIHRPFLMLHTDSASIDRTPDRK